MDNVKITGPQRTFSTGSVRDNAKGKPRMDLIPASTLLKLGIHYGNGASHYGDRNWEKGQPVSQYIASFERHMNYFKNGITDENHLIAAIWNLIAIDYTLDCVQCGTLPRELDDRPAQMKGGNIMGKFLKGMVDENVQKAQTPKVTVNQMGGNKCFGKTLTPLQEEMKREPENKENDKIAQILDAFFNAAAYDAKLEREVIKNKIPYPVVTILGDTFVTILANGKYLNVIGDTASFRKGELDFVDIASEEGSRVLFNEIKKLNKSNTQFTLVSEGVFNFVEDFGGKVFGFSSKTKKIELVGAVNSMSEVAGVVKMYSKTNKYNSFFVAPKEGGK